MGQLGSAAVAPGPRFVIEDPVPRAETFARYRRNGTRLPARSFHRPVLETPRPDAAPWLARVPGVQTRSVDGEARLAAFGCAVRLVLGAADRSTRIVPDGTQGPIGGIAGVRYERRA